MNRSNWCFVIPMSLIMKRHHQDCFLARGYTLLELSVVIVVMISLISTGLFVSKQIEVDRKGREASEVLRTVYTAQRLYLSEYPMEGVSQLTAEKLIPYLSNKASSMPTVKSLSGNQLSIVVNQFPPYIDAGSGLRYDPSGNIKDTLWDVGE